MKIGIYTSPVCKIAGFRDVDRVFKFVSDIGYEYVEISGKYHYSSQKKFKGNAGEIKTALKKYDLEATAISYHVNLLNPNLDKRKQANENIRYLIEAASSLNILNIITLAGQPGDYLERYPFFLPVEPDKEKVEAAWKDFENIMGGVVDFATDHSVKVCIEPHVPQLAYNVSTTEYMFKVIPSRNLGLNYDPSNIIQLFIDPVIIIKKMGDRIYHTHAKDVEFFWKKIPELGVLGFGEETHWRFRIPGYGVINWCKFVDALKSVGYNYVLSVENLDKTISFEEGATKALKLLKALLNSNPRPFSRY